MSQRYEYSVGNSERDHDRYGLFEFPNEQRLYGGDWELVASDLADDYYHNHDGWEASWPLEFRIWRDGSLVFRCTVEMETQPTFTAWEKEGCVPGTIGDGEPIL